MEQVLALLASLSCSALCDWPWWLRHGAGINVPVVPASLLHSALSSEGPAGGVLTSKNEVCACFLPDMPFKDPMCWHRLAFPLTVLPQGDGHHQGRANDWY